MADHGGYRAPSHPNQVSGPGKYAKRTDGGAAQVLSAAPDQPYGAVKQQLDQQRAAPMGAQTPLPNAPSAPGGAPAGAQPAPPYSGGAFNAPSQRPGEPVTAGAAIGPGPGPEALNFKPVQQGAGTGQMTQLLQKLSATDTTGIIGQLMQQAQARGA
jgi:hypothetical protein